MIATDGVVDPAVATGSTRETEIVTEIEITENVRVKENDLVAMNETIVKFALAMTATMRSAIATVKRSVTEKILDAILEWIARENCDLVMIGNHVVCGTDLFSHFQFGSIYFSYFISFLYVMCPHFSFIKSVLPTLFQFIVDCNMMNKIFDFI